MWPWLRRRTWLQATKRDCGQGSFPPGAGCGKTHQSQAWLSLAAISSTAEMVISRLSLSGSQRPKALLGRMAQTPRHPVLLHGRPSNTLHPWPPKQLPTTSRCRRKPPACFADGLPAALALWNRLLLALAGTDGKNSSHAQGCDQHTWLSIFQVKHMAALNVVMHGLLGNGGWFFSCSGAQHRHYWRTGDKFQGGHGCGWTYSHQNNDGLLFLVDIHQRAFHGGEALH